MAADPINDQRAVSFPAIDDPGQTQLGGPRLIARAADKPELAGVLNQRGYSPGQVSRIVHQIRKSFADGTVWQNELLRDARYFATLAPKERQAAINLLSPNPKDSTRQTPPTFLQRWLREVTSDGIGPWAGLPDKERRQLLATLVPGQDAINLQRVFNGLRNFNTRETEDPEPFQHEFLEAIEQYGTPAQREGLIARLALKAVHGDTAAARGIASLMGQIKDKAQIERVLTLLDRPTMDRVVAASVLIRSKVHTDSGASAITSYTADPSQFERVARAVNLSDNPREKASFVAAAQGVFRVLNAVPKETFVNSQDTYRRVADGLSTVIGRDPVGVIENTLAQTGVDPRNQTVLVNGKFQTPAAYTNGRAALKAYVLACLNNGLAPHLEIIRQSLMRGNQLSENPTERLSRQSTRPSDGPNYYHAALLGDWLGVVNSAITARIAGRDRDAAFAALGLSAVIDVTKEGLGLLPELKPFVGVTAAALKGAVNASILSWRQQMTSADKRDFMAIFNASVPLRANGVPANGDWVTTMFSRYGGSREQQ
jgi:hypothetical protein